MKKHISIILCLCMLLTAFLTACSSTGKNFVYPDTIYGDYEDDGSFFIEDDNVPLAQLLFWEGDTDAVYDENTDDATLDGIIDALLSDRYVVNELIVKFKNPTEVENKEQLLREIAKLDHADYIEALDVYVIKVADVANDPELSLKQLIKKLIKNTYIKYVEPNYIANTSSTPNDPSYSLQKSVANLINAPAGWDITTGTGSPIIAVIDTGVYAHVDLPSPVSSYSAVSGLAPSNDKYGHGTNVAGVLGMIGNNGVGGAGINWNAKIMAVKVDDASLTITASNAAKGITWAADNGAKVINISIAFINNTTLKSAIDYAYNKGCVIVAGSGNDGSSSVSYPAGYTNVLAVGSTSNGTSRVSSSNYGSGLDVVAVSSYQTTTNSGSYSGVSGTSIASPQVAALASLIWSVNPSLTNAQVYDLIRNGASGNGSRINNEIGYGCINIGKTLELALAGAGTAAAETPKYATPPVITLAGQQEVTINVGDTYSEPGYSAIDCLGASLTSSVKVTNTVNKNIAGAYTVTYEITDAGGNSAKTMRTVFVKELPKVTAGSPTLAIIGSSPLTLEVGTAYIEQKAKATDYDGTDLSASVNVSGAPDTSKAGTYYVTYTVTNSAGNTATAIREVQVIAKAEVKTTPTKYGFSASGKAVTTIKHTGIVAKSKGFMDLTVTSIDKNMTITVELYDVTNSKSIFSDTFTAAGSKQYEVDVSTYELRVTISKGNGNCSYKVDLSMP